jgi:Tfp pilus assembly protein PilF
MIEPAMTGWKITGFLATIVIVLSFPLYIIRSEYFEGMDKRPAAKPDAVFVGSDSCKECHKQEYDKWNASHHKMAMAAATEETVLGNFDNAAFEYFGTESRFYRKDGGFFVRTQGPDGDIGDYEITYTFGWYPLQQYLIPFPGGRMQCLPIAWDVQKEQWYHLYPDQPVDPTDWLYWTNSSQTWNGMCAECHPTNLVKGYDFEKDTYATTWSEISVGCEACHGPGSHHVAWAQLADMARPQTENYELAVETSGLSPREQNDLCAPCHSRRSSLRDNPHRNIDFMDYGIPQLLAEGYYFADGQILEEVYVYGSFMQSKMYSRDVRCSDCHDAHSIKRIKEGNALCLQCHKAAIYDTKDHHFHKKLGESGEPIKSEAGEILFDVGTGALCEECHMPGRYYMGIDYRPDHSFRIPRPDLSESIGVPNACNRCHIDQSNKWSSDYMQKWYGERQRPHYGTIFHAGRNNQVEAVDDLIKLSDDRLYPPLVRATALQLLSLYEGEQSNDAYKRALSDEEALLRQTAVRQFAEPDPRERLRFLAPLLYDPVKAVRIEAAQNLTAIPSDQMPGDLKDKHRLVLEEYRQAMERSGDFAASRHNLGNMYANLGDLDATVANYRKAIEIDREFYPAKVNLAMMYNQTGKNKKAEQLLREVVADHPDFHELKYSLALLLVEEKQYQDAESFLAEAATGMPDIARVHYNLGLLRQQLGKEQEAEASLRRALEIEPDSIDFLYALAEYYLRRGRLSEARTVAERMISVHPQNPLGDDLLNYITAQSLATDRQNGFPQK